MRSVNTAPYEVFLSRFYEILNKRNFTNEVILQSGFGFPDLLKVPLLLTLFISITLLSSKLNISGINRHLPHYFFLSGAIITALVLAILANSDSNKKFILKMALSNIEKEKYRPKIFTELIITHSKTIMKLKR